MLPHIDAFVCLPHGDRFPRHYLRTLLQAHAALSTIATRPFPFAGACPTLDLAANCRSNPIAHRVRRKRQRLPPSLLIENASVRDPAPPQESAPRRFRSRLATNRPEHRHRFAPSLFLDTEGYGRNSLVSRSPISRGSRRMRPKRPAASQRLPTCAHRRGSPPAGVRSYSCPCVRAPNPAHDRGGRAEKHATRPVR